MNRTDYELVAEIREIYEQVFKVKWHQLEGIEKYKIKERLRPDLGHPANVEKLETLLREENERAERVVTLIHEVHRQSMFVLEQRQLEFFNKLASTSEWFLVNFDSIVVRGDVHASELYREDVFC